MALTIEFKDGRPSITYGVTKVPGRKNKCLFRLIDSELLPMAYFKTDADAKEFEDFMHSLMPGKAKPMAGLPK